MAAAGGDGGHDPFEMTFFCGTNVVYPSFYRKQHVMVGICRLCSLVDFCKRWQKGVGSTCISSLDALAENGELRATKRVRPDKEWKGKTWKDDTSACEIIFFSPFCLTKIP